MNEYEQNIEIMKELRNRINNVLKDQPSDIGVALTEPMGIPDPVKHKYVSFAKSAVRIAAGVALVAVPMEFYVNVAGGLLILAEILGVVEEIV